MPESQNKPQAAEKPNKPPKQNETREVENQEEDQFDFGGLPKHVPFKRNIGCGG